jgi:undecaprenyl-diphosphatase
MTIAQAIILGIVQGLTEFIPVSSSAHLVLVPYFFGWEIPIYQAFPFDVLVQLGTLVAVIIYFWTDLREMVSSFFEGLKHAQPFADHRSRLGWYVILATIPAGIAGLLFKDQVEAAFDNPIMTGVFLFVTAAILFISEWFGKRSRNLAFIKWPDAVLIGIAQIIAILPGVSRSGSTIGAGMLRNFQRPAAARFSFLMSIPIMLAASLLSLKDLFNIPDLAGFLPILLAGFVAALIIGYASIHWLLRFLNKRSLNIFAIYCVVLGLVTIFLGYVRK